jgi:hypothetical protein
VVGSRPFLGLLEDRRHRGVPPPFMLGSDSIDASSPALHGCGRSFLFYFSHGDGSSARRDTVRLTPPSRNERDRPIFPDRTACKRYRRSFTECL